MPPSLEAERVDPWHSLLRSVPAGPFVMEAHFGHHKPACAGHALLAHVGVWPFGCKNMITVTFLMITAPTFAWLYAVQPIVGRNGDWLSLAVTLCLLTLTLGFLTSSWLIEPGIMHVVSHRVADRQTGITSETWYIKDRATGKEHDLVEFRAKFCRETGNCIANFDHYVSGTLARSLESPRFKSSSAPFCVPGPGRPV
jgi:hypothetical protein